jgi:hypothetical protein
MKNIYIIFLIHVILIIGIIFKATAESPATLENVNAGNSEEEEQALSQEDKDAEELWKKVTEDYGDLSEDEYDALKKDKLKKIDALKAAGGDDKHVEELLQLVEESDRLREEYASESAGAGDLMKEINELLNGDTANIFDDILVQQVDDVLNDNDDLKDLKDLMKDTGAATLVDITPGNNNDKKTNNNNDETTTTTTDGEENPTDPSIADLMAEVKNLMADFEVDGSVQALKDAMMAAYTEEGGESAHQQNDEL